jgi:hypothetical protein
MRWPHERRQARRFVHHALILVSRDLRSPKKPTSSNPRGSNGAATNETARVRWPDRAPDTWGFGSEPAARNRCLETVLALALRPLVSVGSAGLPHGKPKAASGCSGERFGQTDGFKRSALTFRRLLLSRRPSTLWLDGRCDENRCYPALSNSLSPGDPGCVPKCSRRFDLTSGSG